MADSNYYQNRWSTEHERWFRERWDYSTETWVFHDWPPVPERCDSVLPQPSTSVASGINARPASHRVGNPVNGSYNFQAPVANSHYEYLDSSYCVRSESYFIEGTVFAILFTEPAGSNATINAVTDYNTALSWVRYNELAHTQVRRFIVVRRKRGFCYAVPIFSYSNQGTKKRGVIPQEHAIAYAYGTVPRLLDGEQVLSKTAIPIELIAGERLSQASRIFFGIHHPIQHNVKVKDLGRVHPDWMPTFLGYWNMENVGESQQSADVTRAAAYEPDEHCGAT
ncbi:hypothetical protein NX059_005596 [Plenodomus lindquistii]|nr:hypothetical protein NX059_005596 [Plenodomus lindquistii]